MTHYGRTCEYSKIIYLDHRTIGSSTRELRAMMAINDDHHTTRPTLRCSNRLQTFFSQHDRLIQHAEICASPFRKLLYVDHGLVLVLQGHHGRDV